MKRGIVYYRDIPAGELVKDDDGYLFRYDPTYFVKKSNYYEIIAYICLIYQQKRTK